jgi:hypothetical protein
MQTPHFLHNVLRRVETLQTCCAEILRNKELERFYCVAEAAQMLLQSSSSNDYYEKIGAECIGFVHQTQKHGADGKLGDIGAEIKPTKETSTSAKLGVINDDTPMKLLKDHEECQWLVALRVAKDGSRVNWALVAPFHYWEQSRFTQILDRLNLTNDPTWTYKTLPLTEEEKSKCFQELVKRHQKNMYVRSSELKLSVITSIPKTEYRVWIHPDLPKEQLPKLLVEFK